MASISTIYDGVITNMGTLFPLMTQLPNPLVLEENAETVLEYGYAVRPADATNSKRVISCQRSMQQNWVITLTRQTFKKDTEVKDDPFKAILEDVDTLINAGEKSDNFGLSSDVIMFRYENHGGIDQLRDGMKFIKVEMTFSSEYLVNIT